MSREEAIEIFKRLKENAPNEMHLETVGTAQELFDMAIQALSQEPCDDLISREAILDTTICEGISCNECSFNEIDGESGCLLHARIDELPSVTQKSGVDPQESKEQTE